MILDRMVMLRIQIKEITVKLKITITTGTVLIISKYPNSNNSNCNHSKGLREPWQEAARNAPFLPSNMVPACVNRAHLEAF